MGLACLVFVWVLFILVVAFGFTFGCARTRLPNIKEYDLKNAIDYFINLSCIK